MKWYSSKFYLIVLMLIWPPFISAINTYGGGGFSIPFNKCYDINITILGTEVIDEGEYNIVTPGCYNISNNTYRCNCTDNWFFNVTFPSTTINTYTFYYNYTMKIENGGNTNDGSGRSGGSRNGGYIYTGNNNTNQTQINNSTIQPQPITNDTVTNENSTPPMENIIPPSPSIIITNTEPKNNISDNSSLLPSIDTNNSQQSGLSMMSILMVVVFIIILTIVGIVLVIYLFIGEEKQPESKISVVRSQPKATVEGEIQYIMAKIIKKHIK